MLTIITWGEGPTSEAALAEVTEIGYYFLPEPGTEEEILELTADDLVMARNIEIKARIESVELMARKVAAIADQGPSEILQDDAFFACERGRLKLRTLGAGEGQLIFYQRANRAGPKESSFSISPTTSPDSLRHALSLAYGQTGRVRKHRTLYLVGRTRVHLDRVEELGHFLELEVVLGEGEAPEPGVEEAHRLMTTLGIDPSQLIEGAYVDLLAAPHTVQMSPEHLVTRAYEAFNARDIEGALAAMHREVDWPNGMEGGYVHGHDGVRVYWTRQWCLIDPHVEPRRFTSDDTGRTIVDVHQVVRDRAGTILTDQTVQHVYWMEDGLIKHMEIRT